MVPALTSVRLKVELSNRDTRADRVGPVTWTGAPVLGRGRWRRWEVRLEVWRLKAEEGGREGAVPRRDASRPRRGSREGWAVCGSGLGCSMA